MDETPHFTIVIPTYNRASLIRQTIESVLAQQESRFEVIVVDDGSQDETEQVVRSVTDPRVTYFKKANGERAAARNYGAARARGQYINFLDSDDLLYPNHLTVAGKLIAEYDRPAIFHLGFEMKDASGNLLYRIDSFKGSVNEKLLRGNVFSCNGVFLRKDIAQAFPFNEDRRLSASEDWELWLRLAARYEIYYSNEVTSVIVNHEDRSVLTGDERALVDRKTLTLKYLSEDQTFVEKYGSQRNLIEAEFLSYIALHLALAGKRLPAARFLTDSVRLLPASIFSRRFLAVIKHIIRNSRKI